MVEHHEVCDTPASLEVRETSTAFRSGRVIDLRTDVVAFADGSTATRDVVVHPGAVGVIALDDQQRVLLVRQYRHPVGRLLWEPPAGLLDEPGEDPLATAKRELFEEAHHQADRWNVLLDIFTSPGMADEAVRLYLARGVRPADGPRHEATGEELDMPVAWVPLEQLIEGIFAGKLHNPLLASGVLAAAHARTDDFRGLRDGDAPWPERL